MRAPARKPTSLQRVALFLAVGFLVGLGLGYIFMGASSSGWPPLIAAPLLS